MSFKWHREFELHWVQGEWYYLSDEHELFISLQDWHFHGKDGLQFAYDTMEYFLSARLFGFSVLSSCYRIDKTASATFSQLSDKLFDPNRNDMVHVGSDYIEIVQKVWL